MLTESPLPFVKWARGRRAKARKSLSSPRYRQLNHRRDNVPQCPQWAGYWCLCLGNEPHGLCARHRDLSMSCAQWPLPHSRQQPSTLMMLYWFKVFHSAHYHVSPIYSSTCVFCRTCVGFGLYYWGAIMPNVFPQFTSQRTKLCSESTQLPVAWMLNNEKFALKATKIADQHLEELTLAQIRRPRCCSVPWHRVIRMQLWLVSLHSRKMSQFFTPCSTMQVSFVLNTMNCFLSYSRVLKRCLRISCSTHWR